MINKDSKVVVSFKEINPTLVSKGKYSSAKINVKNAFKFDEKTNESLEVVTILEQSKTILEPVLKNATRSTTMSSSFVEMALTRPNKPRNGASYKDWDLFNSWNKISDKDKIRFQLEKIAEDMYCELITFEII